MKKKKLLFINGHLNTGGVEKALLDFLNHLDYEKYEVDLLLMEKLGDYTPQLPGQVHVLLRSIEGTYGFLPKVILKSIRNRDWFSLKMRLIFLLMRWFGNNKIALAGKMLTDGKVYDCVIGFRRGFCTQIAAHAVKADYRITWWHHGCVNVEPAAYLEEVSNCHQIVAVSEGCRRMLAEVMPTLEDRLVTIHNMLDANRVWDKANAFDPYPDKSILHVVSVGGLVPEKHFDNAIYAARQLKDRGFRFRWHLVGDGVLRDDLRRKAVELDVTDCFIFEGNQVNPYPYMKHADLFVHPSYVESFGIVVTEALALGVPCVITRSSGVMDFLSDGENAVLTEQCPEDLTEKVLMVLQNTELCSHLKDNARCPEQFCPEAVMKKIDDLLEARI
ncbi:MAG: glycosyltransferase [Oscillospiraceae bacterium]|nr:glycosyltransferase [Oscillospiraceae bacterium]